MWITSRQRSPAHVLKSLGSSMHLLHWQNAWSRFVPLLQQTFPLDKIPMIWPPKTKNLYVDMTKKCVPMYLKFQLLTISLFDSGEGPGSLRIILRIICASNKWIGTFFKMRSRYGHVSQLQLSLTHGCWCFLHGRCWLCSNYLFVELECAICQESSKNWKLS